MRHVAQRPQRLDQHPDADAIIERLANQELSDGAKALLERDRIANPHEALDLVARQPEIDHELLDRRNLLALLFGGQMHRLAARVENTRQIAAARANHDVAGEQVAGIETTELLHAQETVLIDEFDDEADLVHVRGDHDALRVSPAL